MKNNTYYFSHDYNATQDPRMMLLLSKCGLAGIGFYWIIIEILHQQEDGKISREAYKKYLEFYSKYDQFNDKEYDPPVQALVEKNIGEIEEELFKSGLLKADGDFVYSERVLANKMQYQKITQVRSLAGKAGAKTRWQTHDNRIMAKCDCHDGKMLKERKGKERKDKEERREDVTNLPKTKEKPTIPPSLAEISAYCKERGDLVDPHRWYDYYTANGWMVGRHKMKDWRAAVRTWERNWRDEHSQTKSTEELKAEAMSG